MTNNILIINGSNSPINEKILISYFDEICTKNIFYLNKNAKPKNFNNKETLVRIFANKNEFSFSDCQQVFIIESLTSNQEKSVNDIFCETEFLINSIKTKNKNTKIYLIATDFGYARQDRALNRPETTDGLQYETAEPEALKLKLQNLYNAGLSTLVIFDPHSLAIYDNCKKIGLEINAKTQTDFLPMLGNVLYRIFNTQNQEIKLFFDVFSNKKDSSLLSQISEATMLEIIDFFNKDLMLVAPDKGCSEKTRMLSQAIHQELTTILLSYGNFNIINKLNKEIPVTIIKKVRSVPGQSFIEEIEGNARGRVCLIIDDILDTGGTLCNAAEALKNEHNAKSIHCFITHGVLSVNAVQKLNNSCIETICMTNSITSVYDKVRNHPKFAIYDLFDLITQTICYYMKNDKKNKTN